MLQRRQGIECGRAWTSAAVAHAWNHEQPEEIMRRAAHPFSDAVVVGRDVHAGQQRIGPAAVHQNPATARFEGRELEELAARVENWGKAARGEAVDPHAETLDPLALLLRKSGGKARPQEKFAMQYDESYDGGDPQPPIAGRILPLSGKGVA